MKTTRKEMKMDFKKIRDCEEKLKAIARKKPHLVGDSTLEGWIETILKEDKREVERILQELEG